MERLEELSSYKPSVDISSSIFNMWLLLFPWELSPIQKPERQKSIEGIECGKLLRAWPGRDALESTDIPSTRTLPYALPTSKGD